MLHDLSHDNPGGSGPDAAATGEQSARQEAIGHILAGGTVLPPLYSGGRFLAIIKRGGGKAAVAGLGVAVLLAAGGCAGHQAAPAPPSARSTAASTPAPTATPLTAAELAWIAGVTSLHHKVDKPFRASSMTMTRAKMTELGNALRACGRELRRMGAPGTRLQPVYVKVTKACRALNKGARCFAKAASVSDAAGATVAGTAEARIQNRSLSCGFAAQGNGSNLLSDAEAQAAAIKAQFP
jgi:hypothetical protein